MFEDAREQLEGEPEPPRIGVKRYVPVRDGHAQAGSRPGLTLLMLPGMGMPAEVSRSRLICFVMGD